MARIFNKISRNLRWLTQVSCFSFARLGIFRKLPGELHFNVPRTALINPFMNCQGCELAWAGCPIGMFQMYVIRRKFPFYILGYMTLFAAVLGRAICGWLCPFGFFQDVIDKFAKADWKPPEKLRYLKYVNLAVLTIMAFLTADVFFCKYMCFTGLIFGVTMYWFTWRNMLFAWLVYHFIQLIFFFTLSYKVGGRAWCQYLCPLGAFFSLFDKIGIVQLDFNRSTCISCGKCSKVCPMGIDPTKKYESRFDSIDCIRCGECVNVCPTNSLAITLEVPFGSKTEVQTHETKNQFKY